MIIYSDLYSETWTVWMKYMSCTETSWTLNHNAAPTFIMGDYEQILSLHEKGEPFCISFGNNASRKSFLDNRLPENCLAAKRVLMRNQFTQFCHCLPPSITS